MNKENKIPVRELCFLTVGEAVTSLAIVAVYLIIGKFDYTVALGAALGSLVIVLNFLFLTLSVNRALDNVLAGADFSNADLTPSKDIDGTVDAVDGEEESYGEEKNDEISKFAKQNEARLANAIRLSYIVRTVTMIAALILAIITKKFNLIALVIPLFMQRPLLTVAAMTKKDKEG